MSGETNPIYGVMPALVTNVEDPDGEGKVQVTFPVLPDIDEKPWAPVATLMSGKQRGSYFMPEVDDEVLVAFDRGDFQHPYIVGFLWNGVDTPPDDDINTKVRRIKTVSGHIIDFDDNSGKEKIHIKTQGKHELELSDADKTIRIKTKAGHQIEMNDTDSSISVVTKGKQSVELKDTPASVIIHAASGDIKIEPTGITVSTTAGMVNLDCLQATIKATTIANLDCLQANVTAKAMMNITAPMTVFSGVVKVPAIIADAVVGSAYTPAPGNLLGL